jgi:hypothetical protein
LTNSPQIHAIKLSAILLGYVKKKSGGEREMNQREIMVTITAAFFVIICISIMVFLHEQHYRKRRVIIDPNLGIEDRLSNVERILLEDRYT